MKNFFNKHIINPLEEVMSTPSSLYKLALRTAQDSLGIPAGKFVKFTGVGNKDVYNTSGPFNVGEKQYIAGRVETREKQDSLTMFFQNSGDETWALDPLAPVFQLEDPFQSWIDGQLIIGGVKTLRNSQGAIDNYFTVFYRGTDIYNLEEFKHGPLGMKDIRLLELPPTSDKPKQILVFGRPQGGEAGRGKISVILLDSLDQLDPENINKAVILKGLSSEDEWTGVNDLYLLPDGNVGVLYHIARAENSKRYYSAATMVYNLTTGEITDKKIIATWEAFPVGPVKMLPDSMQPDDLKEVVFPSRLVLKNSSALLYAGLSDTTTVVLQCTNPFKNHFKTSESV